MLADRVTLSIGETLFVCLIGLAVVIAELALISLLVKLVSGAVRKIQKKAPAEPVIPDKVFPEDKIDEVVLENTDERTAALIMAIVSEKSGIPPERLRFKKIKLLDESVDKK